MCDDIDGLYRKVRLRQLVFIQYLVPEAPGHFEVSREESLPTVVSVGKRRITTVNNASLFAEI